MQRLFLALFLLPFFAKAQKITRQVEPDNQALWIATDDVNLNFKLITSNVLYAHFRAEGPDIYIYLLGTGEAISGKDYVAFTTDKDTVVAHSTGTQPGGWNNNIPYHEYKTTLEGLQSLSRNPLKQVVISHYSGWQTVDIPEKDQNKLMSYGTALLKAMNN